MSVTEVKAFFKQKGAEKEIILLNESCATVPLAAAALGVEEAQIAKTLAFKVRDVSIVIVTSGRAKIDNKKFKDVFQTKAKMMSYEETLEKTGHPVGGVCPFGLPEDVDIYIDKSLTGFETVYPAAGDIHAILKMTPQELISFTQGQIIDVCNITT